VGRLAAVLVLLLGALWLVWSANPYTPAGYVGYLTRGALFGRAQFVGLQTGPTSPGRGWLLNVINISVTPYTYQEEFKGEDSVLAHDNLKVSFRVHLVWRIRPEVVRDFVEHYSTLEERDNPDHIVRVAYNNFLREPLRTFARDEVQRLNGLAIKDRIPEVGEAITHHVRKVAEGTPFEVRSVVVGNIQYPPEVADAVARKLAATQELERKSTEIEITRKEKDKRVIEAQGIAEAMNIISQRLSASYLQYEAIKAQRDMVGSPNHTVVYIPVGPLGVPMTGTFDLTAPGAAPAQPEKPAAH
jgi:regulator of protease activity HflC (stomatin/prohibitin superfamily)